MRIKAGIFSTLQISIFLLSMLTNWYPQLVLALFVLVIIMMLDNLGKGIVLREIIALHGCFVCLVMPLVGYVFFPKSNPMARLWGRYMPIPEDVFYSYALPAMAGFTLAMCWPLTNRKHSDHGPSLENTLAKARAILEKKPMTGVWLLAVGTLMFKVSGFLPETVQFAFLLLFFASFAGFLYVYFGKTFRHRKLVLLTFFIFILIITLSSGMFTIVAYMGLTLFSFFFLGRGTALWKKVLVFCTAILLLILVQSVKPSYRLLTWRGDYQGNKGMLFASLIGDKLTKFEWQSADAFFPIYYRTNQGYNIALTMRRFPEKAPYDNGNNLLLSFASAFVPRFLWPDKPEAGGKFNMRFYTGMTLKGWSTNVGPLGEAYGSFGAVGGIVYMIFLGVFIRWAYRYVFVLAQKIPLLIFWIPVLFYQVTYSAESDTLQIINSLIKAAFFMWLLYKLVPDCFVIVKKRVRRSGMKAKGFTDDEVVLSKELQ